jgi:hypothetical protein
MERHSEGLWSGSSIEKLGVINQVKEVESSKYIGTKAAKENIESMAVKVKKIHFGESYTTADLNIRRYNVVSSVPP